MNSKSVQTFFGIVFLLLYFTLLIFPVTIYFVHIILTWHFVAYFAHFVCDKSLVNKKICYVYVFSKVLYNVSLIHIAEVVDVVIVVVIDGTQFTIQKNDTSIKFST